MGEQANAEVETLLGARLAERFGNEVHFGRFAFNTRD